MTEEQLIKGCVKRDINAQKCLYNNYAGKMLGICLRYVRDEATAHDLLHDGFIRLFDKIGNYSGIGSFEGWIRKLFVNICLEYLRKTKLTMQNNVDVEAGDIQIVDNEAINVYQKISADELLRCVCELPTQYRSVFNLYVIDGYSHEEIAQMLGINAATSRSNYTRARAILQEKLKKII